MESELPPSLKIFKTSFKIASFSQEAANFIIIIIITIIIFTGFQIKECLDHLVLLLFCSVAVLGF
jgi:hypothetical protein